MKVQNDKLEKSGVPNDPGISPSPGTPGEGRGEGDLECRKPLVLEITLTQALSRSSGRGGRSSIARLMRGFSRPRPGSVLILVVALLVLLALLGTAYINTTQTDRYSSAQNSFDTEVDLLIQGLKEMTQAAVVSGVSGPVFHQDTSTTQPTTQYAMSDYPMNTPSEFIADRYPTLPSPSAAVSMTGSPPNLPLWQFISQMPGFTNFESPYVSGAYSPETYTNRSALYPSFIQITINNGTSNVTQNFPALTDGKTFTALAGDADGDGIADCGLFRLPIGELNGVTYYGGVRVVDNAAAVNAAIALGQNSVAVTANGNSTPPPGQFFPTNVDLYDLLVSTDQSSNYSTFNQSDRFGAQSTANTVPIDDTGTARSDFTFGSQFEAFWMQVGRRLANPGYNYSSVPYVALPTSEMQTMESHFILHDPLVSSASNSSSVLEKDLPDSCFNNSKSVAYAPDKSFTWAQQNFDFANPAAIVPLRPMLVTQNGVSNFTYSKLHVPGSSVATNGVVTPTSAAWAAGTYNFGDWVTFSMPYTDPVSKQAATMTRSFVCMQTTTASPTMTLNANGVPVPTSSAAWEPQPWNTGPTKASANTATFGQLWSAYYSAMTDTPITAMSVGSVSSNAYKAMFRSSLRTVTPPAASPWDTGSNAGGLGFPQLQLRAAIAAINTLQLRSYQSGSATAAPLSATINLNDAKGNSSYTATVYGSAPQPYITEVYASTIGGTPYVAVELYNPYSFAISLATWQLAYVSRTAGSASLATAAAPITAIPWTGTGPTVPANSYITLESGSPPGYVTAQPTGTPTMVGALANALGNELVLLRPAPTTAGPPGPFFGTTAAPFTATVPVDSYDFTGLTAIDPPPGHDWHYIRPNDPRAGMAWHFVYPGPYSGAGTAVSPRQAGTEVGTGTPQTTNLATLGAPDAATLVQPTLASSSYIDRPLQIDNAGPLASPSGYNGVAGPNKPTASGNMFPYGGFARNADLLQVTYVGAYQITSQDGSTLYELNALPADSGMADDGAELNRDVDAVASDQDGRENIGRFCPVNWADTVVVTTAGTATTPPTYSTAYGTEVVAMQSNPPTGAPPTHYPDDYWTPDSSLQTAYHWAFRLFDYITVQSPQDDYLPDADPAMTTGYPGVAPEPVANVNPLIANAQPTALNSANTSSNEPGSATEETVPVHGRININTANWRVLATLPFFDNPYNQAAANDLARAIVYYRDMDDGTSTTGTPHPHGAFQSIEELNNVPVSSASSPTALTALGTTFRNAFGQYLGTFPVPGLHGSNVDGDLSPFTPAASTTAGQDQVYGDFENQNLALNRISNLITTRSDSFTAYVIVQGWRNVGTTTPQLVVQRRAAFIIDRSPVTPANVSQPSIVNVPE